MSRVIDGDTIVVQPISIVCPTEHCEHVEHIEHGDRTKPSSSTQIRVRLAGIDCPEKKQAYGLEATRFLSDRILGKKVVIQASGMDRYGRVIGTVWIGRYGRQTWNPHPALSLIRRGFNAEIRDLSVNEELIQAGLAWHYKKYSKDQILEALENLPPSFPHCSQRSIGNYGGQGLEKLKEGYGWMLGLLRRGSGGIKSMKN